MLTKIAHFCVLCKCAVVQIMENSLYEICLHAGNYGGCIYHLRLDICFDEYMYCDFLPVHLTVTNAITIRGTP